jgi:hypothetical protein
MRMMEGTPTLISMVLLILHSLMSTSSNTLALSSAGHSGPAQHMHCLNREKNTLHPWSSQHPVFYKDQQEKDQYTNLQHKEIAPQSRREKSMGMNNSSSTRCRATWFSIVTRETKMNIACLTALPAARTSSTPDSAGSAAEQSLPS